MPLFEPALPEVNPEFTVVDMIRQVARAYPEQEAVVCGETRLNWREFDLRVNRVANALLKLGIQQGDRVAVLASTSVEYLEIFVGTLRAGACLVPLSTMAATDALEKMLNDSGTKVLFLSQSMRSLAGPFLDGLTNIIPSGLIALDFEDAKWSDYDDTLAAVSDADPLIDIAFSDYFNIIYSSGTTGVPKGILHDHQMRAVQMERVTQNGYTKDARTLISTPLYSNTTIVALVPTLVGGGTVVLMSKFDARGYLELVERECCTHTMLVPVQYKRIMDVEDFDTFDLSSMQGKFCTSAPLRADLKRDVLDRFPGELKEYYGLTEGAGTTVLEAHLHPDKLHTVGVAAPGVVLKFIDEAGNEIAQGKTGEICGRSAAMMRGYFGRDDFTADYLWQDANGDHYFRSGDMGFIDEDGFVHLTDRKKDMIISGGLNIFANDLELVLFQDDDVEDAAVIGIPSEQWGETPLGLVVLGGNSTKTNEEILAAANATLGKSQRLSGVEIRQSLPRSSIGKILKRELRQPYWENAK